MLPPLGLLPSPLTLLQACSVQSPSIGGFSSIHHCLIWLAAVVSSRWQYHPAIMLPSLDAHRRASLDMSVHLHTPAVTRPVGQALNLSRSKGLALEWCPVTCCSRRSRDRRSLSASARAAVTARLSSSARWRSCTMVLPSRRLSFSWQRVGGRKQHVLRSFPDHKHCGYTASRVQRSPGL